MGLRCNGLLGFIISNLPQVEEAAEVAEKEKDHLTRKYIVTEGSMVLKLEGIWNIRGCRFIERFRSYMNKVLTLPFLLFFYNQASGVRTSGSPSPNMYLIFLELKENS